MAMAVDDDEVRRLLSAGVAPQVVADLTGEPIVAVRRSSIGSQTLTDLLAEAERGPIASQEAARRVRAAIDALSAAVLAERVRALARHRVTTAEAALSAERRRLHDVSTRRVGTRRLTSTQVADIFARYTGRRGQQSELAREFGVSEATISRLLHGPNP